MDVDNGLTNDDLAAFEEMRAADNAPEPEATPAPEAPAPEPVEPAADADAEPAEPQGEARQKLVPLNALREERERRKALEKQAAERERLYEERFNALLQRFTAPPAAPAEPQNTAPPLPDPEKDPVGYLIARQERIEHAQREIVQAIVERDQQGAQAQQQQLFVSALQGRTQAMVADFARETPDYGQAANFLAEARDRELRAAGWEDPAERRETINNEAIGLAHRAIQMGRNPASIVYELAKQRGYARPAAATAATSPAAEKISQIAAGQQQARTLGNVQGSAPPALNFNTVANMSQKEFAAFLDTATPEQMAAAFGA